MATTSQHFLASLALLSIAACANQPEWSDVDPDQLWATSTGKVVSMTLNPTGSSRVDVVPDDTALLAPGQDTLPCVLEADGYDAMRPILGKLGVGDRVRVSGYWVARRDGDAVEHQLNQVTSLARLP